MATALSMPHYFVSEVTLRVPRPCFLSRYHVPYIRAALQVLLARVNPNYAEYIHGDTDGKSKRVNKPFAYSPLKRDGVYIHGLSPFSAGKGTDVALATGDMLTFEVRSRDSQFSDILLDALMLAKEIKLPGQVIGGDDRLCALEVEAVSSYSPPPIAVRRLHLEAITPLVVGAFGKDGQFLMLHPVFHPEAFEKRLFENLYNKWEGLNGELPVLRRSRLRFTVDEVTEVSCGTPAPSLAAEMRYEGDRIWGYFGKFTLEAHPLLLQTAYYAGVGGKNGMGFGFAEIRSPSPAPRSRRERL